MYILNVDKIISANYFSAKMTLDTCLKVIKSKKPGINIQLYLHAAEAGIPSIQKS